MKVNDIVELCKAGFKADQILQLVAAEHNEGQGAPAAPAAPAPAAPAAPAPAAPAAPAVDNSAIESKALDQINATLKSLTSAIHANNIQTVGGDYPKDQSVDDIITAAIINPPSKA
jgi:hypothetical protein